MERGESDQKSRRWAVSAGVGGAFILVFIGGVGFWTTANVNLDLNADVCTTSSNDLIRQAGLGDLAGVRAALVAGADPSQADAASNTALGCAIPRGHHDVAALLLDRGADPDGDTGDGQFMEVPLSLAIRRDQADIALDLLDAGADTNRVDCQGTPLEAALSEQPTLVPALIDNGADPNGPPWRRPPLIDAVRTNDVDSAALLLQNGADADGRPGARPAIRAASNGDDELLDLLIEHGASLDVPTGGSSSAAVRDDALDLAASNGHVEMVRRLLDAGADPDDDPHLSPLLRSTFYGHDAVVAMLLEHGADADAGEIDDLTLVGLSLGLVGGAPQFGDTGTTLPPMDRSTAILDVLGATPDVGLGAFPGTTSVRTGTAYGTDAGLTDPRLDDCQGLVQVLDELQDVDGVVAATKNPDLHHHQVPPLAAALVTRSNTNVALLLSHGADPNVLALGRYTPLYLAGVDCNIEAARLLLEAGADPGGASEPAVVDDPGTGPSATGTTIVRPRVCDDVLELAHAYGD